MLARYMLSSCVRPSVRLSHAGVVPKRLNVGPRKQRQRKSYYGYKFDELLPSNP